MSMAEKRFQHWYTHSELPPDLREELKSIQHSPREIEERFHSQLSFGTGGLRGQLGAGTNRLNIYTIRKASLGLAHYLLNQNGSVLNVTVVIAYDCRHRSQQFADEAALTLAKQGITCYVFPSLRTTPELSFAVRKMNASAGIVITASHNPPEYNGFKVYGPDGAQLNVQEADKVIAFVNNIEDELSVPVLSKEEAVAQGLYNTVDSSLDDQYVDYVVSLSLRPQTIRQMKDRFRIVYTPLHGTGLVPVLKVLHKAGFTQVETVEEQAHPDPDFSTVSTPNPEEHAAFQLAIDQARANGADMIIGTDPDADRMGIVVQNQSGDYEGLTGNQTGALLLHYILTRKKETGTLTDKHTLCKTIVTSELGRKIAASFGLETIDTLTGFKFIGEKIKQFKEEGERIFVFGYEESYGYLIGDEVRDKDAVQAVLLAAEMGAYYKSKGLTVYEALLDLYETYGYYKEAIQSITLTGQEGLRKIQHVMSHLRAHPLQQIGGQTVNVIEDYLSGIRVETGTGQQQILTLPSANVLKYFLDDGTWVCIRPSGTEPKLKIYYGVNGTSQLEAERKNDRIKNEVDQLIKALL